MSAASPSFACRPRWFAAACAALVAFGAGPAPACTTAVISGKATADGRPLLWKSRDLRSMPANEAVVYQAGGRRVLAVVNVGNRDAVWMGVNSSGFCIENSLSLDLADAGQRRGPSNGGIMKEALETCGTVEDFRALLERSDDTGRRTVGNFGVIDAHGGAALFEVGPRSFRMFDANDPQVAPHGYIVRSNFATTAKGMPPAPDAAVIEPSYSTERYARACRLLDDVPGGSVSVGYLLRHVCRDLADSRGRAVAGSVNGPAGDMPETVRTASTISRTTTVSAAVFHGVKPGEDPLLTTMWVALGDPKFSIAVPCWAAVEELTDAVGGQHGGAIGSIATTLRAWTLTPDGDGVHTEHLRQVWDDVWPVEDRLLATVAAMRDRRRTAPVDPAELTELHRHLSAQALDAMRGELVDMKQAALSLPAPPPPDFAPSP